MQIRDRRWFDSHINYNANAIRLFESFVEDNFHSFYQPGTPYQLVDVADPRYYIYLRQMLDRSDYAAELDELLVDTLILIGLEGTNSAKNIYDLRKSCYLILKLSPALIPIGWKKC